jgi:hypothetical protein
MGTHFSKAGTCDKTYIACSNNSDIHQSVKIK